MADDEQQTDRRALHDMPSMPEVSQATKEMGGMKEQQVAGRLQESEAADQTDRYTDSEREAARERHERGGKGEIIEIWGKFPPRFIRSPAWKIWIEGQRFCAMMCDMMTQSFGSIYHLSTRLVIIPPC